MCSAARLRPPKTGGGANVEAARRAAARGRLLSRPTRGARSRFSGEFLQSRRQGSDLDIHRRNCEMHLSHFFSCATHLAKLRLLLRELRNVLRDRRDRPGHALLNEPGQRFSWPSMSQHDPELPPHVGACVGNHRRIGPGLRLPRINVSHAAALTLRRPRALAGEGARLPGALAGLRERSERSVGAGSSVAGGSPSVRKCPARSAARSAARRLNFPDLLAAERPMVAAVQPPARRSQRNARPARPQSGVATHTATCKRVPHTDEVRPEVRMAEHERTRVIGPTTPNWQQRRARAPRCSWTE